MSAERFCDLPSGIRLCYRVDGDESARPLLLVAGLGLDLASWPQALVDGLLERGFRVLRFDNRDIGRSTHVTTPPPGPLRQLFAVARPEDYDLGDMADDTIGLLDHLGIDAVDLVGMSMGGMIAQIVAARAPSRVRSLTSIFSTTGAARTGRPAHSTLVRMGRPPVRTAEAFVARHLSVLRHIGSTEYPFDERIEREWALRAWERGGGAERTAGVARQIGAIGKSGDRTAEVRTITAPTLVVHGDRDRMVHPSGGEATAAAIPGARHVVLPGMRHHLAPTLAPRLVELIAEHTEAARDGAGAPRRPGHED